MWAKPIRAGTFETQQLQPDFCLSSLNFCTGRTRILERSRPVHFPVSSDTTFEHFFRCIYTVDCRFNYNLAIWGQKMCKIRKNFGTDWLKLRYFARWRIWFICSIMWRCEISFYLSITYLGAACQLYEFRAYLQILKFCPPKQANVHLWP
jgi:hypothetical protein